MYSSRAISDMKRALDNLDVSPWNMKVIIREFVHIFRIFVLALLHLTKGDVYLLRASSVVLSTTKV